MTNQLVLEKALKDAIAFAEMHHGKRIKKNISTFATTGRGYSYEIKRLAAKVRFLSHNSTAESVAFAVGISTQAVKQLLEVPALTITEVK